MEIVETQPENLENCVEKLRKHFIDYATAESMTRNPTHPTVTAPTKAAPFKKGKPVNLKPNISELLREVLTRKLTQEDYEDAQLYEQYEADNERVINLDEYDMDEVIETVLTDFCDAYEFYLERKLPSKLLMIKLKEDLMTNLNILKDKNIHDGKSKYIL